VNQYAKMRKDELIARLIAAESRPPAAWSDVPTLLRQSVSAVSRELPLLVTDCQRLWAFGRRCCILVIDTYRRPIFKTQGT
jgi:hypothetical protein